MFDLIQQFQVIFEFPCHLNKFSMSLFLKSFATDSRFVLDSVGKKQEMGLAYYTHIVLFKGLIYLKSIREKLNN